MDSSRDSKKYVLIKQGDGTVFINGCSNHRYTPPLIDNENPSFLLMHDIIHHQNNLSHIGEYWDELEAVGGLLYFRKQNKGYIDLAMNIIHYSVYKHGRFKERSNLDFYKNAPIEVNVNGFISSIFLNLYNEHEIINDFYFWAQKYVASGYQKAKRRFNNNLVERKVQLDIKKFLKNDLQKEFTLCTSEYEIIK